MVHRIPEDCKHSPLQKEIEVIHLSVVRDTSLIGTDIFSITDLDQLIDWWLTGSSLVNPNGKDYKTKELTSLIAAIWIQINILHPKCLLKFSDLLAVGHEEA